MDSEGNAWGYALICFVDENTMFPLTFVEPVFSQEALTTYNRMVREAAVAMNVTHDHDFSVKMALLGTLHRLIPVVQKLNVEIDCDGIVIGVKLLSTITGMRYSIVKVSDSGTVVERLASQTLADAKKAGADVIKVLAAQHGSAVVFPRLDIKDVDENAVCD